MGHLNPAQITKSSPRNKYLGLTFCVNGRTRGPSNTGLGPLRNDADPETGPRVRVASRETGTAGMQNKASRGLQGSARHAETYAEQQTCGDCGSNIESVTVKGPQLVEANPCGCNLARPTVATDGGQIRCSYCRQPISGEPASYRGEPIHPDCHSAARREDDFAADECQMCRPLGYQFGETNEPTHRVELDGDSGKKIVYTCERCARELGWNDRPSYEPLADDLVRSRIYLHLGTDGTAFASFDHDYTEIELLDTEDSDRGATEHIESEIFGSEWSEPVIEEMPDESARREMDEAPLQVGVLTFDSKQSQLKSVELVDPREADPEPVADGGKITVCPSCESSKIEVVSTPSVQRNDVKGPGYRCANCRSTFTDPDTREPKRQMDRPGLAGELARLDPSTSLEDLPEVLDLE